MEVATDEAVQLPYMSPATKKMMLELSSSGLAVCTATACTNPIDVVKVRIQLQSSTAGPRLGIFATGVDILRHEGVTHAFELTSTAKTVRCSPRASIRIKRVIRRTLMWLMLPCGMATFHVEGLCCCVMHVQAVDFVLRACLLPGKAPLK